MMLCFDFRFVFFWVGLGMVGWDACIVNGGLQRS